MISLASARARIGDVVVYDDGYGQSEQGPITSVNDRFVFVRYGTGGTSAATDPKQLTFLAPGLTLDEAGVHIGETVYMRELYGHHQRGEIKAVGKTTVLIETSDGDTVSVPPHALTFETARSGT